MADATTVTAMRALFGTPLRSRLTSGVRVNEWDTPSVQVKIEHGDNNVVTLTWLDTKFADALNGGEPVTMFQTLDRAKLGSVLAGIGSVVKGA